jgi:DNA-binding MarR family transcriptional regulator
MSVPVGFNELIHAPMRLQICAMLSAAKTIEFAALRDGLEVSDSVLSKHVRALNEAGYVSIHRAICASRLHMSLALTDGGREQYQRHMSALRAILGAVEAHTVNNSQATGEARTQRVAVG